MFLLIVFRVIDDDLKIWNSGISREAFERRLADIGTHYQVIDHELYRQTECRFPRRYSWIIDSGKKVLVP